MGVETALAKLEFDKILQRIVRFALSDPGKHLIEHLQILESPAEIRQKLSLVTECKHLLEEEETLPLDGIFDIQEAIAKASLEGSMLQPEELRRVGSSAAAGRLARAFLAKRRESFPLLGETSEDLYADKVLEFNISQAIDDSGSVRDSASKDLEKIRRNINEQYSTLRRKLESILRHATAEGYTQDEIITTREGRMVIPVKTEHKHSVPGFVHSASSSGATVFVEPAETLEMNNAIRTLHFQEQREIQRILRALTAQVRDSRRASPPEPAYSCNPGCHSSAGTLLDRNPGGRTSDRRGWTNQTPYGSPPDPPYPPWPSGHGAAGPDPGRGFQNPRHQRAECRRQRASQ